MTVEDLLKRLQKVHSGLPIVVRDSDGSVAELTTVCIDIELNEDVVQLRFERLFRPRSG